MNINAYINTKITKSSDCQCCFFEEEHWDISFSLESEKMNDLDNYSGGWREICSVFEGTREECERVLEYCHSKFPKEGRGDYAPTGTEIFWLLLERFRPAQWDRVNEIHG